MEVGQPVEPGGRHQKWSHRPLPALEYLFTSGFSQSSYHFLSTYFWSPASNPAKVKPDADVEYKHDGQDVDKPVHHVGQLEISPLHL